MVVQARSTKAGTGVPATLEHVGQRGVPRVRSTKAGTGVPATLAPGQLVEQAPQRSTKAGTGVPATRASVGLSRTRTCSLNEGRNRGPGNTGRRPLGAAPLPSRSTKAGTGVPATPHEQGQCGLARLRSTKAGTGVPATPGGSSACRRPLPSLNEGRNRGPGNTEARKLPFWVLADAQRRPEPGSRQHGTSSLSPLVGLERSTKAGTGVPATLVHGVASSRFLVGAQRRPEPGSRQHEVDRHHPPAVVVRSTKAGTGVPATRVQRRDGDHREHRSTKAGTGVPATPVVGDGVELRLGRSTKAGTGVPATRVRPQWIDEARPRSTKAGTGVPATHAASGAAGPGVAALNEGRNRGPGNTRCFRTVTSSRDGAQRRPEPGSRQHALSTASNSCPMVVAQRRPEPGSRQHADPLGAERVFPPRSTKAGTGVPATPFAAQ